MAVDFSRVNRNSAMGATTPADPGVRNRFDCQPMA